MIILLGVLGGILLLMVVAALMFRRVVPTNSVHIVQSSKKTLSYGKDMSNGNVYYEWPSSIPVFGVEKIVLPVSVFDIDLQSYEAYDQGRLPFVADIKAFFRISDSNVAAQKISSFGELQNQLMDIVKGAARTILASSEIEEILQGRSKFGEMFTKEVKEQLTHWGVEAVKNIELMDIRDTKSSQVIGNIMEKKKSLIEMQSRQEVASNIKAAQISEIEASKEVDLGKQDAKQVVGLRTVEADREVALENERSTQTVKEQQKATKEKEMAVLQVEHVRKAEINKEVEVVRAEQDKKTRIVKAEADKETTVVVADGELEATKRRAEGELEFKTKESKGIELEGLARAVSEKEMQMAPVHAQIELADKIDKSEGYQKYLATVEQIKAMRDVGVEQAGALKAAEIKIVANSETPGTGLNKVMDIFSAKGGAQLGTMLEGFKNTDIGEKVLDTVGLGSEDKANTLNGSGNH